MIVSSCYLSSVKSFPPRKAENQMDYDCFSSCFKECYVTQGKKKSRAMVKWALDKWLSIQVNLWWYAHHSTVTQHDKMGCSQLLCQFACLTSRLLYHLVWYLHSLTITYFSSETMNWVVWWHLYIKWKENWRKGDRGKFNFLGFLH